MGHDKQITLDQVQQFINFAEGLNRQQLQDIYDRGFLSDIFEASKGGILWKIDRDKVKEIFGLIPSVFSYKIKVDYGRRKAQVINERKFDWDSSTITFKCFPTRRSGKIELTIKLVDIGRKMDIKKALEELDEMHLRPAELLELLAFREQYPDIHRVPIIGLGSVWKDSYDHLCSPMLCGGTICRTVMIFYHGRGLGLDYLIAGVPK